MGVFTLYLCFWPGLKDAKGKNDWFLVAKGASQRGKVGAKIVFGIDLFDQGWRSFHQGPKHLEIELCQLD